MLSSGPNICERVCTAIRTYVNVKWCLVQVSRMHTAVRDVVNQRVFALNGESPSLNLQLRNRRLSTREPSHLPSAIFNDLEETHHTHRVQ